MAEGHGFLAAWRNGVGGSGLNAYDEAIKGSIGLRLQERLSSDQAASVVTCLSIHRDISLNF